MKYLSCAETAKLIRTALKEAFPGIKFGVRSKTYSGGASITIGWTDGPNTKQVEAVTGRFEGSYFDGMIDYQGSITSMLNGEQVRFLANFVFTNRKYSDAFIQRGIDAVLTKYGTSELNGYVPTVEDYNQNRMWNISPYTNSGGFNNATDLQSLVSADLSKRSTVLAGASPTAAAIFPLCDDGYGLGGVSNIGNGYPGARVSV